MKKYTDGWFYYNMIYSISLILLGLFCLAELFDHCEALWELSRLITVVYTFSTVGMSAYGSIWLLLVLKDFYDTFEDDDY